MDQDQYCLTKKQNLSMWHHVINHYLTHIECPNDVVPARVTCAATLRI